MTDKSAKLRRLDAFRRSVPHVTAQALAMILEAVVDGIPQFGRNRNALRMARNLQVNEMTDYGPLIETMPIALKWRR